MCVSRPPAHHSSARGSKVCTSSPAVLPTPSLLIPFVPRSASEDENILNSYHNEGQYNALNSPSRMLLGPSCCNSSTPPAEPSATRWLLQSDVALRPLAAPPFLLHYRAQPVHGPLRPLGAPPGRQQQRAAGRPAERPPQAEPRWPRQGAPRRRRRFQPLQSTMEGQGRPCNACKSCRF